MAEFGLGSCSRDDAFVYGAQRPGFPASFVQSHMVDQWISYMKGQGITHVVCLLSDEELAYYPTISSGLLQAYLDAFGQNNVLWAPTRDRTLLGMNALKDVCLFLYRAMQGGGKSVVHCSAGLGRTGQALAAWLIFYHRMSERKAVRALEELNRSPKEAVFHRNASEADLLVLLGKARELDIPD
jgi:protein-tyrosine phosphatase